MTLGTRHNIAQHCKKNPISPLLTECWKVDEHILGQPEGQLILSHFSFFNSNISKTSNELSKAFNPHQTEGGEPYGFYIRKFGILNILRKILA